MAETSELLVQSSDWVRSIATPSYVLDMAALKRNLARAAEIKREASCKILLATKAFALPAAFPVMREVLDDAVDIVRPQADAHGMQLIVCVPSPALPPVC